MTVLDLIKRASIMAGTLAQGEELDAAEAEYGLNTLNDMLDLWSVDRLTIPKRDRIGPFNLVSGTQSYAIGAGGAWDAPRPMWIDSAGLIDLLPGDDVEIPMTPLTLKEWARVRVKSIQSSLPRRYFYDKTYPLGTFYAYPVPNEANQVALYVPVAVAEFATTDVVVSLPPGYRLAAISNLAVLLAMGNVDLPAEVASIAAGSYAAIKAGNVEAHMDPLVCDTALLNPIGGMWNWLTGDTEYTS